MQFIPNGPDIPETLLQAHEEGRVVFFCGAGISYKVGLKDFQWLVDEIYQRCGMMLPKDSVAYKHERYDIILNNLEEKLLGQRSARTRHGRSHGLPRPPLLRPRHKVHTAKIFELAGDLPMVIEIVDITEKIEAFLPVVETLLRESGAQALVSCHASTDG